MVVPQSQVVVVHTGARTIPVEQNVILHSPSTEPQKLGTKQAHGAGVVVVVGSAVVVGVPVVVVLVVVGHGHRVVVVVLVAGSSVVVVVGAAVVVVVGAQPSSVSVQERVAVLQVHRHDPTHPDRF